MSITSIKDIIKTIVQSFQPATIIPSLIFVIINIFVVFPQLSPVYFHNLSNDNLVSFASFSTVTLSYILFAFNSPMVRLLEGHIGRECSLINIFITLSELKKKDRYKKLRSIKNYYPLCSKKLRALQELDTHFPSNEQSILATKIGNTIAAFEHYPYTHYGIDAVAIWPRLYPILKKNDYIEFVAEQKGIFDFFLNMIFVTLICGVELSYLFCYLNKLFLAISIPILTYILFTVLYTGILNSAVLWGYSVRVAFDLYRSDLWEMMRLKPAANFKEEIETWKNISKFFKLGKDEFDFNGFSYGKEEIVENDIIEEN